MVSFLVMNLASMLTVILSSFDAARVREMCLSKKIRFRCQSILLGRFITNSSNGG